MTENKNVKCKYFKYEYNHDGISGILCSNKVENLWTAQVSEEETKKIVKYRCCSETGCRKCEVYKYLKTLIKIK